MGFELDPAYARLSETNLRAERSRGQQSSLL
jgi:hypothetical protein